ncbi:MAG: magnesium transporter [Candidatus Eutrophobiaceae bacterium]
MSKKSKEEKTSTEDSAQILHQALTGADMEAANELLSALHETEIAILISGMPLHLRERAVPLIQNDRLGEVMIHLPPSVRTELLGNMPRTQVARLAQAVDTDDAIDLLQDLPENTALDVLRSMDSQNRARLTAMLSYPDDTAGGLMNTDVISVRPDVPINVVMRYLRSLNKIPDKTDKLAVVDRHNVYLGALPLADIFCAEPKSTVAENMIGEEAVDVSESAEKVALLFEKKDFLTLPVVDEHQHLVGRVTVDDVIDVLREEAERNVRNMAGITGEDDLFSPASKAFRKRALWQGFNLLAVCLAAKAIDLFQASIQELVALAVLMPIVAGMSGVVGSQTLIITVRGMAMNQLGRANIKALLKKEVLVGLFNGTAWALVIGPVVWLWFGNVRLALILSIAMVTSLLIAATAGALIPFILKRLNIDPAVAGVVVLIACTDICGYASFLGLATLFLI